MGLIREGLRGSGSVGGGSSAPKGMEVDDLVSESLFIAGIHLGFVSFRFVVVVVVFGRRQWAKNIRNPNGKIAPKNS